jgi:predicted GNAT superfamily acetyltransferase
LGVLPEHRGARIGFLLKKVQALGALRAGIGVINWTVDPLQWPNAMLNFGLLRAVACDFTPDYYPFRNELNRVPASRFSLTWLVKTERVQSVCGLQLPASSEFRPAAQMLDLARERGVERVNAAAQLLTAYPTAERIAIELPADWTALQRDNLNAAQEWRMVTDELLQRLIGQEAGQYVVTDVAVNGPHRYLVAQRAGDELWARLGK